MESREIKNIRESTKGIAKGINQALVVKEAFERFAKVMAEVGIRLTDIQKKFRS